MFDYNTVRAINGAASLVVGLITLFIGMTLLWRGYGERRDWVNMVPGRVVIGSFLTLSALIVIEAAFVKLWFRDRPVGQVGPYINNWYVNTATFVAILLGAWAIRRLLRNTLGSQDFVKPDQYPRND